MFILKLSVFTQSKYMYYRSQNVHLAETPSDRQMVPISILVFISRQVMS